MKVIVTQGTICKVLHFAQSYPEIGRRKKNKQFQGLSSLDVYVGTCFRLHLHFNAVLLKLHNRG